MWKSDYEPVPISFWGTLRILTLWIFFIGLTAGWTVWHGSMGPTQEEVRYEVTQIEIPEGIKPDVQNAYQLSAYENVLDDVLWLARCIYSESNRADEQEIVAWVVRNRYESAEYPMSYRDVIMDKKQFSAFNLGHRQRDKLLNMWWATRADGWPTALNIAAKILHAPAIHRPVPEDTYHFYSPVSMKPAFSVPRWAANKFPLASEEYEVLAPINRQRFLFYNNI